MMEIYFFVYFFCFILGEVDNILKEWSIQGRKLKVWRVLIFCYLIGIFWFLNYLLCYWDVEVVLNI